MNTLPERPRLRIAAALATLCVFGACAGSEAADRTTAAPRAPEVTVEGIAFRPGDLTVAAGDTVTWVNEDPVDHTITSGRPGKQGIPGVSDGTEPKLDGLFDEPLAREGSTFSFTFEEPGTFVYFCRVHAAMKATITVE